MIIMPNPEVYADVSVHIGDLWRSLPWAIIGKENSTTDLCMRTWTQSTGQLGHGGGNNKWHKQTLCRDQKAIMRECFHTGHRTWSELPLRLDVSPLSLSLWFYSSWEFPSQWKRHDKFFPAFPQSKAFQIWPQAVCQPSNLSVSHTTLVLQECRTQVRLGVSPFNVSDFICNVSTGRKRMWKNRTCDGMLNIFSWKAIILLVYISVYAVKLCNLKLNEPTCVDRILLYIIFFPHFLVLRRVKLFIFVLILPDVYNYRCVWLQWALL